MLPEAVSERDGLPIKPRKNTVKNETQICESKAPERDADTFNIWRHPCFHPFLTTYKIIYYELYK